MPRPRYASRPAKAGRSNGRKENDARWTSWMRQAGAIAFRAAADRATTLANLQEAIRASTEWAESAPLLDTPPEMIAASRALGLDARIADATALPFDAELVDE